GARADRDALGAALADVGLERQADARVRTFSAGKRPRLEGGRPGLNPPPGVPLQQPVGRAGPRVRQGGRGGAGDVEGRTAGGAAVLMATHSFGRELGVADRLAILVAGRVVLDTPRAGLDAQDVQRLYIAHTEDVP